MVPEIVYLSLVCAERQHQTVYFLVLKVFYHFTSRSVERALDVVAEYRVYRVIKLYRVAEKMHRAGEMCDVVVYLGSETLLREYRVWLEVCLVLAELADRCPYTVVQRVYDVDELLVGAVELFREQLGVVKSLVVEALGVVDVYFQLVELVALYRKECAVVGVVIVVERLLQKLYQLGDVFLVDVLLEH